MTTHDLRHSLKLLVCACTLTTVALFLGQPVMASAGAPACHCIGEIVAARGVRVLGERGELPVPRGWNHFAP